MSYASNAVLAKCRAKYGQHLTVADTGKLSQCRSVAEVTAYLKSHERYREALASVNPTSTHRGQLETALYAHHFAELANLCSYELSVGEKLADYILMRGEIEQLLAFLRLFSAGRQSEYVFSFTEFWRKHSRLDFAALARCEVYEDFLRVMEHSRYYKVLSAFAPKDGERLYYAQIEHALYELYFSFSLSLRAKGFGRSARQEMRDFIGSKIDITNLSHIYRLKKFYSADPSTITSLLYSGGSLGPKIMKNAVSAESPVQLLEAIPPRLRSIIPSDGQEESMSDVSSRLLIARKAEHLLRFSVNPSSVLVAYVQLADDQIRDLFTIIEGVRYGLDPQKITELIIIDNLQ